MRQRSRILPDRRAVDEAERGPEVLADLLEQENRPTGSLELSENAADSSSPAMLEKLFM
jgi:hypothetical protein